MYNTILLLNILKILQKIHCIEKNLQFFNQREPILVGTKDYKQKAMVSPSFFPQLLRP